MIATRKKALVVKSFKDAGTGRSFTEGETPSLTEGQYLNYFAAGLLREVDVPIKADSPNEADPSA